MTEIQSDSLNEISEAKSISAYQKEPNPLIVEDDSLFIEELNGFPGQYSAYVYKTIGNEGVLKLLTRTKNRSASFRAIFAFYDGKNSKTFEHDTKGRISDSISEGGWGYDPIYVPDGTNQTFGQLYLTGALDKFAKWYKNQAKRL